MFDLSHIKILPRLIRLRDAPFYLGMDKNRFNHEVRKKLTEIPIGKYGIAFDRFELDAWVEQRKQNYGKIPENIQVKQPKKNIQHSKKVQKKWGREPCLGYQEQFEAFQKAVISIQAK